MSKTPVRTIPALKVRQWLADWDEVDFDPKFHRRKPPESFYMFTLNASELKLLSGIERRNRTIAKEIDLGIQRRHEENRSKEIGEFVRHGYPWSEMSQAKRDSGRFDDLKKPGWLPTALVVNILTKEDKRRAGFVAPADLITISEDDNGMATLHLPAGLASKDWVPSAVRPIEVIDGQHRLWAFEGNEVGVDFELPVVAFHGLDVSWQAYLFWTINIKPKKINASLAFDLYPLLRSEDWLEKFEGHFIYRETRSQELVERVWAIPASPWYQRINMLGETGTKFLSQAAWVRALTGTYVRTFDARKGSIGGLFGATAGGDEPALLWSRSQQAAFLIFIWAEVKRAVWNYEEDWASDLRGDFEREGTYMGDDPAFYSPFSLLGQDQGVRAFLHVTNDLFWVRHEELLLADWEADIQDNDDEEIVNKLIKALAKQPAAAFLKDVCSSLVLFDWRSSSAPNLEPAERDLKLVFRGTSGYKEFRVRLLKHIASYKGPAGEAAGDALGRIQE